MRSNLVFFLLASAIGAIVYLLVQLNGDDYLFFAGYTVVQFIVLATAWNILGGYCGYVNFGSAAFFAVGAYGYALLASPQHGIHAPVLLLLPLVLFLLVLVLTPLLLTQPDHRSLILVLPITYHLLIQQEHLQDKLLQHVLLLLLLQLVL